MNVDITALLMAIVNDFGGEIVIDPKSVELDYSQKCLVPSYYPARDLYVLRLEDLDQYEGEIDESE